MTGLLLINLGSTKSPGIEDMNAYLDEFLMDEYVIDFPYWLRSIIVRKIILKSRPRKAGDNYQEIWWKEGSPLLVISERVRKKLDESLTMPVVSGMRYGQPSLYEGLKNLADKGVTEVLAFPLYPQYTMSSIKTATEKLNKVRDEHFKNIKIKTLPPFYEDPAYIDVLSKSISEEIQDKEFDKLLFSYHGIPKRHERKTSFMRDGQKISYRDQCLKTSELVAQKLGLQESQYSSSFQSRLGIDPWIKPFTKKTLQNFPKQGIKKLAVVAPAFVADCIETLGEMNIEGREDFLHAGGESFFYIPCLNDRADWLNVLKNWATDMSSSV